MQDSICTAQIPTLQPTTLINVKCYLKYPKRLGETLLLESMISFWSGVLWRTVGKIVFVLNLRLFNLTIYVFLSGMELQHHTGVLML